MTAALTFRTDWPPPEVVELHRNAFAASEGAAEGDTIAGLAANLLGMEPADHVVSCSAADEAGLAGNIIFSRLFFEADARCVFVLGPVAVETSRQKRGVGQALLRWGLDEIRRRGAEVAVTYGDPAYYLRAGFEQIGTDIVPPPQRLQWPDGWMAQSLTDSPIAPFAGPCRCVPAFDRPQYW